jgi:hypothetical protein
MPESQNIAPLYHCFDPLEWEIFLAHIKGFQHVQVAIRSNDDHKEIIGFKFIPLPVEAKEFGMQRPYTPLERLFETIKVFAIAKNIKFMNAKYHAHTNSVEAIGFMDGKRAKESQKLYQALLNWDEKVLDDCVNGRGGRVNAKLGFSKVDAPPLEIIQTLSDLEFISGESVEIGNTGETGTLAKVLQDPKPTATIVLPAPKQRGRPPKVKP